MTCMQRRKTRDAGFTLLELLISVTIVALIVTVVYSAFTAGTRSAQHGSERAQIFHAARIAMQDIITTIENMEFGQTNYLSFVGTDGSASFEGVSVGDDTLTLSTLTLPARLEDRWFAGRARVQYRINRTAEPRGDLPTVALEKLVSRVTDENLDDAYTLELSRDIVGLTLEYFEENAYRQSWDSEFSRRLPEYVEITLHVREGDTVHLLRSGALIPHMVLDGASRRRVTHVLQPPANRAETASLHAFIAQ